MPAQEDNLAHTKWECKSHVVFIPKFRRRSLYGLLKKDLGGVFHELARQKDSRIEVGHLMPDLVHMLISIPPKHKVSEVVGFIKGKSAIWIARHCDGRVRNFTGQAFWARGYYVSTVGRDEKLIREYIRNQEAQDRREDGQMNLPFD